MFVQTSNTSKKNLQYFKEKLENYSHSQRTEQVGMKDVEDWIYNGDNLSHKKGRYFSVIGLRAGSGHDGLILDQRETALIGLLIYQRGDETNFLLQYRCEPGLVKGCNLSTTIQSTPSNYLRIHGGKKTFGIDRILNSNSKNRIVFDSFDYDYGSFFLGKIKRFVVVELDDFVDPPEGFEWVSESLVRSLLYEDYMFSTDLRVMIGKYFSSFSSLSQVESGSNLLNTMPLKNKLIKDKQVRIDSLKNVRVTESGITQIIPSLTPVSEAILVRTSSLTREITDWTQPLLRLNCAPVVSLLRAHFEGQSHSLCKLRSEPGINDFPILGPTSVNYLDGPEPEFYSRPGVIKDCEVLVSMEGGRFMQTGFRVQIYRHSSNHKLKVPDEFTWVSDVDMKRIVSSSMSTSVELRYCLSLV